MKRDEAKLLFKRIKSHYNTFVTDEFKFNEWFKELAHCNVEDVNKNFEKHLNSEQYGGNEPRLAYLVKYVRRDDNAQDPKKYKIICPYCRKNIDFYEYDHHIHRHNSIEYMKSREHYLMKVFKEEELMKATDNLFDQYYDKFLNQLYSKIPEGPEKNRIKQLIGTPYIQTNLQDFMKGDVTHSKVY